MQAAIKTGTADSTHQPIGTWNFKSGNGSYSGKLVDIIFAQPYAGAGASSTSVKVIVRKTPGTGGTPVAVCATDPILAAPGASPTVGTDGDVVDVKKEFALPVGTGTVRPILSATASALRCKKGDSYDFEVDVVGTYTTGASVTVALVFEVLD